ncbi:hypothetical protein LX73_0477 [Fodinibius salinus]|uniref:Surface antigen n=1 Tax=Fodinibius salinus TaxID=860790 RepID=A0A5D3YRL3_9BACT|nr:hypothetical protein [Fodinibius salinus]TYP95181.1 hypothetical protein LX73_0477 [Fodinibius salinus]
MVRFIALLCFWIGCYGLAAAQTDADSTNQDPFKNDPFFSKTVSSFWDSDSTAYANDDRFLDYEPRVFFNHLNENGLDDKGFFNAGPYGSSALYSVYPNLPMFHFNRVNSLFLGYRKDRMQWYNSNSWLGIPSVQMHGLIGYSVGQKEWQYSLGLEKLFGRKKHIMIGGEYHNATATDDEWRVGLNETTLTAFSAGYDYLDYYKQTGWGGYLVVRTDRYLEGGIAFSDDQYKSLQRQTDWALFGAGNRYRINPAVAKSTTGSIDTVNIASLTFSGTFNPKELLLGNNFSLSAHGLAEFSNSKLGVSDFNYAKYTGQFTSHINFNRGTIFKYRLRYSSITGDAPHLKRLYLGGIGTLRALPYKSMGDGNQMLLSNVELLFGKPTPNRSKWIDFDDLYLSLFLDSGWVNYESGLTNAANPFAELHNFTIADLRHNAGIGAGTNFIRCEVAWDLNQPDRAPVLWFRFNPTF